MSSKLKEAREKAGYTVEEVAEKIKVRKKYIINLEEDLLDDMPGDVYVQGYKKIYYKFLGLTMPKKPAPLIKKPIKFGKEGKVNKLYIIICAISVSIITISIYSLMKLNNEEILEDKMVVPNILPENEIEIPTENTVKTDENNKKSPN